VASARLSLGAPQPSAVPYSVREAWLPPQSGFTFCSYGGNMDTTTLLIIIILVILLFGGGFYGRGRWW
jgi:hypothetical protein